MKTYSPKEADLHPQWHLIDAQGRTLGRLATEIARVLMGKDKPIYAPHMKVGDFVVVINASKVSVSGRKSHQKEYIHATQYPGGLKIVGYREMLQKHPERVIRLAVRGMLPKTKLGNALFRRLKVYPGEQHPHRAQVPSSQETQEEKAVSHP